MKLISKRIIYYNEVIDEYDIYQYNDYGQEINHKNYFKESLYEEGIKEESFYGSLYDETSYEYNKSNLLVKSVKYFDEGNDVSQYYYKNNILINSLSNDEETIYFYDDFNQLIKEETYKLENRDLVSYILYKKLDNIEVEEHYNRNHILTGKYEDYFKDNLLIKSIEYNGEDVLEIKIFEYRDELLSKEITKKILNNKKIEEEIHYVYNDRKLLLEEKRYCNNKLNRTVKYIYGEDNYLKELVDYNSLWGNSYTLRIIFERIELDEKPLINKINELRKEGFDYNYIQDVLNINLEELKLKKKNIVVNKRI